ncbi:MAG TPA: chemotaxis protein CheR, partial [Clostridia bacterium]
MHTITDREFHQLAEFIKKNYGINLKEEKRALVVGRLQSV